VVGALATPVQPWDIAVDSDNVYWTQVGDDDTATGMIAYCPRTGCVADPIVLADAQKRPRHIAVDDKAIYWSNVGLASSQAYDGQVWMLAKP
jgi:hypothetical protein